MSKAKEIRSSSASNGIVWCVSELGNNTRLPVITFIIFYF